MFVGVLIVVSYVGNGFDTIFFCSIFKKLNY